MAFVWHERLPDALSSEVGQVGIPPSRANERCLRRCGRR
jgi:hypothetical protein